MTFIARAVGGAIGATAIVAVLLATGQGRFAKAVFEYGKVDNFSGVLRARAYPHLDMADGQSVLLVDQGKHGLASLLDGVAVQLNGSRIYRDGQLMIEVVPGSIAASGGNVAAVEKVTLSEQVSLTGEIADSKCYLGVMNPGEGKVHRDCAVRCISGGIPPALLVRDESGSRRVVLLANQSGEPIGKQILDFVAEPVQVRGKLVRNGKLTELYVESTTRVARFR